MAREISTRSRAVEGEVSSNQGATSPHDHTAMYTQTGPSSRPATRPTTTNQSQNEVVTQLLPTLIAIHEAIEHLAGILAAQPPMSTQAPPVVELVVDKAAQGVTSANADNSSVAKRPVVQYEEPSLHLTKAEIEAMFKKKATGLPLHQKP